MKKDVWNAVSYLRFAEPRLRPALDLLSNIRYTSTSDNKNTTNSSSSSSPPKHYPRSIIDYGCGPGNITPFLHERFPEAEIVGIDSSTDMINTAQKKTTWPNQVQFKIADMTTYIPSIPVDLVYSNAAIHWIPNHEILLPHIFNNLIAPEGVLAFQIPDTRTQYSHTEMKKVAEQLGFGELVKEVIIPRCEHDQQWYFDILTKYCDASDINIWTTCYAQVLKGDDPVANYTFATGLKAVLEALGGEETEKGKQYFEAYKQRMRELYPPNTLTGTTLFPFTRFFVVAKKKKLSTAI